MKTTLVILLILFTSVFSVNSQTASWSWAEGAGGIYNDYGSAICTDLSGNIYVAGNFEVASITFGNVTLANNGQTDFFVAKYSSSGIFIWARSWGENAMDMITSIATDNAGKLFITGNFSSSSLNMGGNNLISKGGADIFVASLDTAGNISWTYGWGGSDEEWSASIKSDASGNVYVNGSFDSPSFLTGTDTIDNVYPGWSDLFLVKMDNTGNIIWVNSAHGSDEESAMDLAVDAGTGDVFVTGYYYSDTVSFDTLKIYNPQFGNLFIVKYNTNGKALWAKEFGGSNSVEYPYGIETDNNGNSYVAGLFFSDTIQFDSIFIPRDGDANLFLVKIDVNGNALWATSSHGAGFSAGYHIAIDLLEDVYLTGDFDGPVIRINNDSLLNLNPASNNKTLLVAKFDSFGNLKWLKGADGMPTNYAMGICSDPNTPGDVFVTGAFSNLSLAFDYDTVTVAGGNDVFVARLMSGTTDIFENRKNVRASFYPNPVREKIYIETENESVHFTIHNSQGQVVGECTSNSIVDVSFLSEGFYILRSASHAMRFVKM